MNRLSFRAILFTAFAFFTASMTMAAEPARPNVILIMADDLREFGGPYTKRVVKTPNLDRLRQRGVSFAQAYAQFPVCNPSRSSLLTGLRCEQTGIVGNHTFFRDAFPEIVTFPQALRQSGWSTRSFGKILHSANTGEAQRDHWLDVGKSWDTAKTVPPQSPRREGYFKNLTGGKLPWCEIGMVDGPDEEQPDGQTASAAIASIRELAGSGKPWLVAAGFHRPHDPFHAPKKYFDLYPKDQLALYKDPADASKPAPLAIPGGWTVNFAAFTDDERLDYLRAYLASVSFMDAQVGRLLGELDRGNLWTNTVVIFMGDHGFHLGERGWWNKTTLFDRSCRAPLIIAAPGVKGGQTYAKVVEFVDLYPTILELCGVKAPHALAGKSLKPVLSDVNREHKAAAFTLVTRGQRFGQSARNARWTLVRWSDGTREFYDRQSDPEEMHDLSGSADHAGTIAALGKELDDLPAFSVAEARR